MNTKENNKRNYLPHEIQLEIKDVVLTKLIAKLAVITKENKDLIEENEMLKKTLSFVLKKVMLNAIPVNGSNLNTSIHHNTSVLHTDYYSTLNTNRLASHKPIRSYINSPSKPTNSFQYTPTEYNTINNNTTIYVDHKVNDYITTLYKRNKNIVNSKKNYLLYKSSSSLYEDIFNTERKNGSYIYTENGLNKNNSQRTINSMAQKASLNRISYRNLSAKNINSSRVSEKNELKTPRTSVKQNNHLSLKTGSSANKNSNEKSTSKISQSLYKIRIRQKQSSMRSPFLANKL